LLARQGFLLRQQEETATASHEIETLRPKLSEMESNLKSGCFALKARVELHLLDEKIIALDYNPGKHHEIEIYIHELELFQKELPELERAIAQLPQDEVELSSLEKIIAERKSWLFESQKVITTIQLELESLPEIQERVERITNKLRSLEEEKFKLQSELIFYKRRLDELKTTETEKRGLTKNLRSTRKQWRTYNLLANAFGKNGIQAFLIEEAIPELESEANDLLARLTDNRLRLTLETQRHNRRGDAYETLEIKIGDENGIRNFQLFSGGEAFRISFALRIALAKLLASRSGAPLKTLFIDEGFGTQDTNGRELLIDSIRTIQDEFDLIFVITHIEELKEAFPVRIEINKDDQSGSNFQLIWN
jgi:exonuclease SbcC